MVSNRMFKGVGQGSCGGTDLTGISCCRNKPQQGKSGKIHQCRFTHLATIEEMSDEDAREEFDINVFGILNVIRNVLPQMRAQGSGHIFNVSSLGAYNVGPLSGIYCATKHAVKAISETLAPDDSPYKNLYNKNMEFYMGQNGNQAGDPKKAAKLFVNVAEMDEMRGVAETTNF